MKNEKAFVKYFCSVNIDAKPVKFRIMPNYAPEVYNLGSNGDGAGVWPVIATMGNNGFGGGGRGFLGSLLGGFLGSLFPNLFNGGAFGGIGGGGGMAAAALGAQAQGNNNADLIIQAVTAQGEQARQATQTLSTMLGQDFNMVSAALTSISGILNGMSIENAKTPLQIVNAIQAGNAEMSRQFCQCCCDQKLLTSEQTNQIVRAITEQGQRQADAIADLKSEMIAQFCASEKRDMQAEINRQAEIITQLRNAENNAQQTQQFAAMLAPLQAQINAIAAKMPNTVPVTYPNVQAVNMTPFYGNAGF